MAASLSPSYLLSLLSSSTNPSSLSSLYGSPEPLLTLASSLVISYLAYLATASLIPRLRDDFIAKGLKGVDLLKGYKRDKDGKLQGPALCVSRPGS
jgi:hypothetical protein